MFQYVNITHSDTDPGLDPGDISATPPAPTFAIHPNNDSVQTSNAVHYAVQPLDIPLVNSDSHHPTPHKLDQHPIPPHSVNGLFPTSEPHHVNPSHRTQDHLINQTQNPLSHQPLSPPHPEPNLTSQHDHDQPVPPQYPRRQTEKGPQPLETVSLPLPLPPPQRHAQPVTHTQTQSTQSQWPIQLPVAPPLQPVQPSNPASRFRANLPAEPVFYNPSGPVPPNALPHQTHPPALVNGGTLRHVNLRPFNSGSSVDRDGDHPHRSPRRRQKRSLVWNFFKESDTDPNVAFCQICNMAIPRGRNLARNTTNLRKHLEHRHPEFMNGGHMNAQPGKREREAPPNLVHSPSTFGRQDIFGVSQGLRNRNSFQFPTTPAAPRSSLAERDVRLLNQHQLQHQQQPQIPISQDRSALSLSAPSVYHGTTHDGKLDHPFRQSQSLEESSSLLPPAPKRSHSSSHPLQINPIPVSNLYNTQSQGNTQIHAQELTESGPNVRSKDLDTWGPRPLRLAQRKPHTEGDCVDEVTDTGDRQPASSEANAALVKFLAAARLPLSTSRSRSLLTLCDVANNRPFFPSAVNLREHVVPNQVALLHTKIRNALASADVIAATIEKQDNNRLLVCHFFEKNFVVRSVCLDVIHPAEVKDGYLSGTRAPSSETSALLQSKSEQRISDNSRRVRKLLQRVSNNFDYWKVTHKVNAVVVSEKGITADNSHFLPEPAASACNPHFAFRDPPDTSSRSSRRAADGADAGNGPGQDQSNDIGCSTRHKIPVLSCLVSTIERIITETICENETVERCFIEPMSRAMFKALMDRDFRLSEASQAWSRDIALPFCNPSPWELREILTFFSIHMETVLLAVKKFNDQKDMDILCMFKEDIMFLHSLLDTFARTVQSIASGHFSGRKSHRERSSIALPAMGALLKSLESLHEQVGDALRSVSANALRAVQFQAKTMEHQDLYAYATLLDPRFKSQHLSKDVLDALNNNVNKACLAERRRSENRAGKSCDSLANPVGAQSNALEHYMDSILPDQSASSPALSSYLAEAVAPFNENLEEYWNRSKAKWPFLARVASRYAVIPCSCGSEATRTALGEPSDGAEDMHLSGKEIQTMSAMELLRMNMF